VLQVTSERRPVRCALCHADLEVPLVECSACRSALHEDCLTALGKCPTLGCPSRSKRTDVVIAPPPVPAPRLGVLAQLALLVLPAVPLSGVVGLAYSFGYSDAAGRLDTGDFVVFGLGLPILAVASVLPTIGGTLYYRRRLGGLRRLLLVLGSMSLAAIVDWNSDYARRLGCSAWEKEVLAPRIGALRRSLDAGEPALAGLNVMNVARGRQGFLLYRKHAVNAMFHGFGLCIAYDAHQTRTPEPEGSIVFWESSVRGVFYFHEYP